MQIIVSSERWTARIFDGLMVYIYTNLLWSCSSDINNVLLQTFVCFKKRGYVFLILVFF